jgi:hypothetical protein
MGVTPPAGLQALAAADGGISRQGYRPAQQDCSGALLPGGDGGGMTRSTITGSTVGPGFCRTFATSSRAPVPWGKVALRFSGRTASPVVSRLGG